MKDLWEIWVKGEKCSEVFEISVIRKSNIHGRESYGWFDSRKLLVSHNGGPCPWPLTERVWNKMIVLAKEVVRELNESE